MFPVLYQVGSFTIRTYGVLLASGFLIALFLARKEAGRAGVNPNRVTDLVLYLLIAS
jgi:phosphatidylglycerol:prolipoprotein diacylglycerol transferase